MPLTGKGIRHAVTGRGPTAGVGAINDRHTNHRGRGSQTKSEAISYRHTNYRGFTYQGRGNK